MRALRSLSAAAAAALLALSAAPVIAAPPARLSHDLTDALAAGSSSIDVIVHGDEATVDQVAARYNLKVRRYLKNGAVIRMNAGQLAAFRDDGTFDHLSADVAIHSSDATTETIEADQVWAGEGPLPALTGKGVGVAVIDSGVDPQHAALQGRIAVSVDFTGGNGVDGYGHGTHVAATIAGLQGRTIQTSEYRGVASGARIINLRVLGNDGSGMASSVIQAIDWAIDNRDRYNIRIINLSLGAPVTQPYRDDPLCEATERAVAAGVAVVTAAGNFGQTKDGKLVYGSITSPGNDPNVITVGALDTHFTADRSDDTVAPYSSRGPTLYDLVLKPDVVAPGSHIISAEAPNSYLAKTYPERHLAGTSGESSYMQLSGTSMAAAVASGALALLFGERADLTPADAKVALQVTSTLMPNAGLLASGAGSIDAFAAALFVHGSYNAAIATTLDDGTLPALTNNFDSLPGVHAQNVSLKSGSSKPHKVVFGTTTVGGRLTLWGKTVVGSREFVWRQRVVKRPRRMNSKFVRSQGDDGDTIIWGQGDDGDTIIWGQGDDGDTIIWGQGDDGDTIIWGQGDDGDTIIWGQGDDGDTIIWGQGDDGDTIIWGQGDDGDTIIWGQGDDGDTIIWGQGDDGDTIIWGQGDDGDTIIWGQGDDGDTIIWGQGDDGDTIIWGQAKSNYSVAWN